MRFVQWSEDSGGMGTLDTGALGPEVEDDQQGGLDSPGGGSDEN
jgi:hypothetical protein